MGLDLGVSVLVSLCGRVQIFCVSVCWPVLDLGALPSVIFCQCS